MNQQGKWFDGAVAAERTVTVTPTASGIVMVDGDGSRVSVDTAQLVRHGSVSGRLKLGHRTIEGWRLDLIEPVDPAVIARLPRRIGGGGSVIGRKTMVAAITVTAAGTIALGLLVFAPHIIARHMPMAWERRLGSLYDLPMNAIACTDPAATRTLNALVDRLDPEARQDGLTIQLLDIDDANAAALPGRRMIVFNGLFDEVEDPDALAGIIAHEIAHVRRRHVATAMVRELGLGTVVTLFGGGAVASGGGSLLSLNFTRGAESEADGDAIVMLAEAGIDPRKTKQAFDRFRALELGLPAWASSHPPSAARGARFAASYDPKASYRPALGAADAKAMMTACKDAKATAKPGAKRD